MRLSPLLSTLIAGACLSGPIEHTEIRSIDKISIYEENPGSIHARLKLISARTKNPQDGSTNCQLWIKNRMVLETALRAMESGSPVSVAYEARGDSLSACRVRSLSIKNKRPLIDDAWHLGKKTDRELNEDPFNQEDVAITVLSNRKYVSVRVSGNANGDGQVIQAQRIDKNADANGDPYTISNTAPPSGQRYHSPMVMALNGDNYVVVWHLENPGVSTQLYYRVFNSNDAEVKAETRIASGHTSAYSTSLIPLASGGFGLASILEGSNKLAIHLYDHEGNETHAHINATHAPVTSQWRAPSMVQKADGNLLIAFGNNAEAEDSIILATYDPDTDTLTDETAFGGLSPDNYRGVKLVLVEGEKPVVAYESDDDIYLQLFNSTLIPDGEPVDITTKNFDITDIQLLALKGGGLMVGWEDSRGFDNEGYGLFAKRLESSLEQISSRLQLNSTRDSDQKGLAWIQSEDDGDVVALWDSDHAGDANVLRTQIGVGDVTTLPTAGTRIGRVKASHPDDADMTYSLIDDAGGRFKIHELNGTVKVEDRTLIDADTDSFYNITVRVYDGIRPSTRTFVIKAVD